MDQVIHVSPTEQAAREICEAMAGVAIEALEEVAALAKLALISMESPSAHCSPETIAAALNAISRASDEAIGLLVSETATIGCSYQNSAADRRRNAIAAARFLKGGGGVAKIQHRCNLWIPRIQLFLRRPLGRFFLA